MEIKILRNDLEKFKSVKKELLKKLSLLVKSTSVDAVDHVRQNYFGATTDNSVSNRTKRLRQGVTPLGLEKTSSMVSSGIGFGTVYSKVHVGESGKITTLKSKRPGGYLKIPTKFMLTKAGVQRSNDFEKNTFIRKTKKGNLIIFGQQSYIKGAKAGMAKGKIVPLYILKKQVKVKARIKTNRISEYVKPKLMKYVIMLLKHLGLYKE